MQNVDIIKYCVLAVSLDEVGIDPIDRVELLFHDRKLAERIPSTQQP